MAKETAKKPAKKSFVKKSAPPVKVKGDDTVAEIEAAKSVKTVKASKAAVKPAKPISALLPVKGPRGSVMMVEVKATDTGRISKKGNAVYDLTPVKGSGTIRRPGTDLTFPAN